MTIKLLYKILFVPDLIFDHIELFLHLLLICIILCSDFQFDIDLLKLLNLLVKVIEFCLVSLYFFFILCDPFLVFDYQLGLVLLKLFNLSSPLGVTLRLQKLNLGPQLFNLVVFLLKLHVMDSFIQEVAAVVTFNCR